MKVVILLAATLLGVMTPMPQQHCTTMGNGTMMMQGMHGAADRAYMQSMMTAHHGMTAHPFTGDADRDFTTMMIAHDQAAIGMARAELKYGKNAQVRAMAEQMIKDYQAEIDRINVTRQ